MIESPVPVWNVACQRWELWPASTRCAALPEAFSLEQVQAQVDVEGDLGRLSQHTELGGRMRRRDARARVLELAQVGQGEYCLVETRPLWHLCRVAPPGADVPSVS